MKIPSAESARAMSQTVLVAFLCNRHHDLATWASEPLRQRIHFLAKPDGSNLNDLYIWDSHLSTANATSLSSQTSWSTPAQIYAKLAQLWSPDQYPLHPPTLSYPGSSSHAWEMTNVYYQELDQETVQALIPISQQGSSVMAIVLLAEPDLAQDAIVKTYWKYHNIVVLQEQDFLQSEWKILKDTSPLTTQKSLQNGSTAVSAVSLESDLHTHNEQDEDDSDDDYWGQYGDTEEEETTKDEAMSANSLSAVAGNTEIQKDEEDEEDEYWRKYAEHQEEVEASEKKKRMSGLDQDPLAQDMGDLALNQRILTSLEPPMTAAPSIPGQVDPNILSSLLHMLTVKGMALPGGRDGDQGSGPLGDNTLNETFMRASTRGENMDGGAQEVEPWSRWSPSPPESDPTKFPCTTEATVSSAQSLQGMDLPTPLTDPLSVDDTLSMGSPQVVLEDPSKQTIMEGLRSLAKKATSLGFTKEQVIDMMETIYTEPNPRTHTS